MRYSLALLVIMAGCASRAGRPAPSTAPATGPIAVAPAQTAPAPTTRPAIAQAIGRGVAYLLSTQNPDGSWGTGRETRGTEILSMVPGSHDAYRVATTALCVMALREVGEKTAHDKGLEYLLTHGEARRDDGQLLYNTWAHMYVLQAVAAEMRTNRDPRLAATAAWHLDRLARYETYMGGWGYYDFEAHTQRPSRGPTSFGTAAGLVALWEARQAGINVPQPMIDRALRRLRETRLPNGCFLYGQSYEYIPRLPANQLRGSIGRNQPCNYALWLWQFGGVGEPQSREGLDQFFQEHAYIDMGRKRPYPHESWYQTAPYYFYFDHYYAALLIEKLSPELRPSYFQKLAGFVVPIQEPDGSWWDYAMWDYHKPYGTAFAVMTLLRCQ